MRSFITKDLPASLVVFVVAIPLSLGISLASGTPVASGLIAAILGGIVVGSLTGAPLVVSGPAAGLIGLILEIQNSMGFSGLLLATVISGLIQWALSLLKMGKLFTLVSEGVLNGMLGAIGFTIVASQLHVLMGASIPQGLWNALSSLPSTFLVQWQSAALLFGCLAILFQVFWNRFAWLSSRIPAALPAVIIISGASLFFDLPRVELTSVGDFAMSQLSQWNLELIRQHWGWTLVSFSLGLALVSSAESLLTARAISNLAKKRGRPFSIHLDRELRAQGAGNILSGALGGIPITGVIVRSAANVNAGAQTRMSACLHGMWILLFVSFAMVVLEKIPLTALAAVLIMTGLKLLNIQECFRLLAARKADGLFWLVTFVAVIASNLLAGLCFGILCQTLFTGATRWRKARARIEATKTLKSAA